LREVVQRLCLLQAVDLKPLAGFRLGLLRLSSLLFSKEWTWLRAFSCVLGERGFNDQILQVLKANAIWLFPITTKDE
jgi:hypothetical protein